MSDEESDARSLSEEPVTRSNGVDSDEGDAGVGTGGGQDDLEDDLFGDGGDDDDDDDAPKEKPRRLDDSDLDSGDDEGRRDRHGAAEEEDDEELEQREELAMEINWDRVGSPEPSDGEMYLLKMPPFLEFNPAVFHHSSWQPPTTEHHSKEPPSDNFSAYQTAMTTIRWRHSPSDPSELQSNARVLRWSDGSLTLQFASDPLTQYEIQPKPLAPPQVNALKPTPLSINDPKRSYLNDSYDVRKDSFTYLGQPSAEAHIVKLSQKFTTSLQVIPAGATTDDAVEKLQRAMALANKNNLMKTGRFVPAEVTEDPALAQKKAEAAEKEMLRAQRRLENQANKESVRRERALNRVGMVRSAGLTIGDLEDSGPGRSRGAGASKPKNRRQSRHDDWSEDEEEGQDYEEDDFVAGDDEEEEEDAEGEDEEDYDALIESRLKAEKAGRSGTPKRDRSVDDDDGAGAGQDSPVARHKRRRIVDEDEDE